MKQSLLLVLITSITVFYSQALIAFETDTLNPESSDTKAVNKEQAKESASVSEKLRNYLSALDSYEANFEQQLVSNARRLMETTSGRFMLKRPDRFRWHINHPYEQLIIADGDSVYSIDMDLEQVTAVDIEESLGNSPILLLSRKNSQLEQFFSVQSIESDNELERFLLKPLDNSSNFEFIQLGFTKGILQLIELNDSLGQMTIITLTNIRINPVLSDSEFIYQEPEGFDLIDSRVGTTGDNQ